MASHHRPAHDLSAADDIHQRTRAGETVSFRGSRVKQAALLGTGVAMTAVGVAFIGLGDFGVQAIGWAAAVFFGLCTAALMRDMIAPKPSWPLTAAASAPARASTSRGPTGIRSPTPTSPPSPAKPRPGPR